MAGGGKYERTKLSCWPQTMKTHLFHFCYFDGLCWLVPSKLWHSLSGVGIVQGLESPSELGNNDHRNKTCSWYATGLLKITRGSCFLLYSA